MTVPNFATIEQRKAVVVFDLLRQTLGVIVTHNGGVGTSIDVNIRGAESDKTVALIDGVNFYDPSLPGSDRDGKQVPPSGA